MFLEKMKVILRPNNSLFERAVHQIQSYYCLFWDKFDYSSASQEHFPLTQNIRKDVAWDMLFADDIVLSRKNHRELEEDLEIWRNALERRGLKVIRSKTEYLRVGGVDDGEKLKLKGEKGKRAKNLKYLGSTVSNDGRYEEEIRRRI